MSLKFREGNIIFKGYRSGFTNPLEVHIDYTKFDESAPFESLELLIDKITENIIKHRFNIFIGDKAQEFRPSENRDPLRAGTCHKKAPDKSLGRHSPLPS